MEALYFFKFWKSTGQTEDQYRPSSVADTEYYEFNEEEDDSFFELELTVPDFDTNKLNHASMETHSNRFDNENQNSELKCEPQSVSLSISNNKGKILPIESPTSASKFRVLMFKKSKSMAALGNSDNGRRKKDKTESKLFTVKLKLKEVPILTRENSLGKQISEESLMADSSRIFSKEVMRKYFKLLKPLFVSRKQRDMPADLSAASPASCSPKKEKQGSIPAGIRVVCKHLGKSKSASAAVVAGGKASSSSTAARRDDSLVLQHDGIQSAILHCKKSFNSSSSTD